VSKEDTIPISLELAKVIQEQQQYIQDNLGEHFEYYFVQENPHGFAKTEKKDLFPSQMWWLLFALSTLKD